MLNHLSRAAREAIGVCEIAQNGVCDCQKTLAPVCVCQYIEDTPRDCGA
jgi:hypothetical protein